jgi:Ca2+/Na+ antiporter
MGFSRYFEGIENIEIWPIISLVIFIIFFVVLLYGVFKMDKKYVQKMENMPLEKNDGTDSLENKIL